MRSAHLASSLIRISGFGFPAPFWSFVIPPPTGRGWYNSLVTMAPSGRSITVRSREKEVGALTREAADVVSDPKQWMETPHELLGGVSPRELIDRGAGATVRNLLRGIRHGD